nr:hypothetical protein B0A51_11798 [Rachicladosporium sp. CCFEE 5018]
MDLAGLMSDVGLPQPRTSIGTVLRNQTRDEVDAALQDVEDDVEGKRGFRYQALSTQKQQDAVLAEYRRIAPLFARKHGLAVRMEDNLPAEINDAVIFPTNSDLQIEYVLNYLRVITEEVKPRADGHERPRAKTIYRRMNAMMHWVDRLRAPFAPETDKRKLQTRCTELLEALGRQGYFSTHAVQREFLGKDDVICLIDHDSKRSSATSWQFKHEPWQVRFQHHLIWTLGLVTGIRPSSIVVTTRAEHFLRWRNVVFRRVPDLEGGWTGEFVAELTFEHLKGKQDSSLQKHKRLTIPTRSPATPELLVLSTPHRLLALALRRSLLRDHADVRSLMLGEEVTIRLRPEAGDLPVFLDGEGLQNGITAPMKAYELNSSLRQATLAAGFKKGCSFYGFRREVSTAVSRKVDTEAAKKILDHHPDSATFIEHYDAGVDDVDLTNIMIEGGLAKMSGQRLAQVARPSHALTRVDRSEFEAIERNAVLAFLDEHPGLAALKRTGDKAAYTSAKERLRRLAKGRSSQSFWDTHQQTLTVGDLAMRKAAISEALANLASTSLAALAEQVPLDDLDPAFQGGEPNDPTALKRAGLALMTMLLQTVVETNFVRTPAPTETNPRPVRGPIPLVKARKYAPSASPASMVPPEEPSPAAYFVPQLPTKRSASGEGDRESTSDYAAWRPARLQRQGMQDYIASNSDGPRKKLQRFSNMLKE